MPAYLNIEMQTLEACARGLIDQLLGKFLDIFL